MLSEVALNVRRGDRLAIIGPNGIGKSTLLKIIVGKLRADNGRRRHSTRRHLDNPDSSTASR